MVTISTSSVCNTCLVYVVAKPTTRVVTKINGHRDKRSSEFFKYKYWLASEFRHPSEVRHLP